MRRMSYLLLIGCGYVVYKVSAKRQAAPLQLQDGPTHESCCYKSVQAEISVNLLTIGVCVLLFNTTIQGSQMQQHAGWCCRSP